MFETSYTRPQAVRLIPLLKGIAREVQERHEAIQRLEEMIKSLKGAHRLHAREISNRTKDLRSERAELKRINHELQKLGCSLALGDRFEIHIPGAHGDYAWRVGENFLRSLPLSPSAA